MPFAAASAASAYVPILFAVSPFAAMRSAPVTTAPTLPDAISAPAAESTISVAGMPSRANSHAVSRAPCSHGRVSVWNTAGRLPDSHAARITPSAVP